MPYYAGLPNLDLYGLCSREVAEHGFTRGARPGHQRHATLAQVLAWQPTFLFAFHGAGSDPVADLSFWGKQGYVWVRAPIAQEPAFLFLARRERAEQLAARGLVTIEAK